jgi:hypothetical protein
VESATDQKASSGKLSGKETGAPGVGVAGIQAELEADVVRVLVPEREAVGLVDGTDLLEADRVALVSGQRRCGVCGEAAGGCEHQHRQPRDSSPAASPDASE